MRHNVAHRKAWPRHRASARAAAQPGHRTAASREDRDHDAEGEGAAAVRRTADHHRPARGRGGESPTARRCTRAGWCSPSCRTRKWSASCSRRSRRGSRSGPAATRGFCGSVSAEGIPPRSRTSSWSAASTTRAAKTDKEEGEEAPKKAKGVGERIKRAAQRMRGGKGEGGSKAQAGGQTKGAARKSTTPRKAGGS